jgi:hypothetical protein
MQAPHTNKAHSNCSTTQPTHNSAHRNGQQLQTAMTAKKKPQQQQAVSSSKKSKLQYHQGLNQKEGTAERAMVTERAEQATTDNVREPHARAVLARHQAASMDGLMAAK